MKENAASEIVADIESLALGGYAIELWREGIENGRWIAKTYLPTQRNTKRGLAYASGPSLRDVVDFVARQVGMKE